MEGSDLLGCAQTGSGKTAAFALPILNYLATTPKSHTPKHARVLVLAPTRELAIQIHDNFIDYGKGLGLSYSVIFGGVSQMHQVRSTARGVDVIIATPGRLLDLINQGFVKLQNVEKFVLDEADRMLDLGFANDIKKILKLLPPVRHNLFFSATMPPSIAQLAKAILVNPVKVEVTPVASTVDTIQQSVMMVERPNKKLLLKHLLGKSEFKKVIVFTKTKFVANKLSEYLCQNGIRSEAIHGNKSQNARQRALENFREGHIKSLVATDIAARGIDINEITHVINYDLPMEGESYVHRIGRTARAGASGTAIAFCSSEEKSSLRDIERLIQKKIAIEINQPFHAVTQTSNYR
jgi:ATP-dependent RNA helicase RhlE